MFETAHKFWVEHVLKKVPPALQTRSQAELIHPAHVEGLSVEAEQSTLQDISRYQALQLELESIEKEIEGIKDGIALTLGSAARLTCDGHTLASWRLAKGANRLDTEKLRRERPDIVEKYSSKSLGSRRLLINTPKANSIHMVGV
jgi:predicted phage-related endonuclease